MENEKKEAKKKGKKWHNKVKLKKNKGGWKNNRKHGTGIHSIRRRKISEEEKTK